VSSLCKKVLQTVSLIASLLPWVVVAHGSNQYSGVQVRWKRSKSILFGRAETNEHWYSSASCQSVTVECVYWLATHHLSSEVGGWVDACVGWRCHSPGESVARVPFVRPSSDAPDLAAGCSIWRLAHSHVTCRWRGSRRDRRKWVINYFFFLRVFVKVVKHGSFFFALGYFYWNLFDPTLMKRQFDTFGRGTRDTIYINNLQKWTE
jgi:hypothetical protein